MAEALQSNALGVPLQMQMQPAAQTALATVPGMPVTANAGLPTTNVSTGGPMANVSIMSGVQDALRQPSVRKLMPAIIVFFTLLIFGAVYAWMQESPYRPIFPGMAEADQQAAMELLKNANFKPELNSTTGQLMVPAGKFHAARIFMASQGLPKAASNGVLDTLKDQSNMTTSQFMEQARYSAAIEQELSKSIAQIGSIESARVHIAQTRQSAFIRDRSPVKASVVVVPFGGRMVSANQVQAIVHLVASSVPYLNTNDVSVVDNSGNLLTHSGTDEASGLNAKELEQKQRMEETYRNRIVQLLEPVVGAGNVRSQVSLDMNFTQTEETSEDYDANNKGAKTRSEVVSEERAPKTEASGIPGALSNSAPSASQATPDTNKPAADKASAQSNALSTKATRNFELDKTIRHVKGPTASVERVSVAVVIKDRVASGAASADGAPKDGAAVGGYTKEELERFQGLVKSAVGFNAEHNDVVTLIPAKFELPPPESSNIPWYENEMIMNGGKVSLAAIVLVVILLTVVRPMMAAYGPAPVVAAATPGTLAEGGLLAAGLVGGAGAEGLGGAEGATGLAMAEGESLDEFKERLKKESTAKKSSISADMLDTANTYDDKVALVRMLVREDSGRVANVLKNMIKRDLAG